jgi:hypothetical protein
VTEFASFASSLKRPESYLVKETVEEEKPPFVIEKNLKVHKTYTVTRLSTQISTDASI